MVTMLPSTLPCAVTHNSHLDLVRLVLSEIAGIMQR